MTTMERKQPKMGECYVELNSEETQNRIVAFVINWTKLLPHFSDIIIDDQIVLLQSGICFSFFAQKLITPRS